MEIAQVIQNASQPKWIKELARLLPLWLVSLSVSVEGFPRPPISLEVATASFIIAILLCILLLLKDWMPIDLTIYSFLPLFLLPAFDEISTTYKTPFIFSCALILTLGALGYQYTRVSRPLKWLILFVFAFLTLFAAGHAVSNFWQMASDLGYEMCFPDYHGCSPLTGNETTWWVLFLRF